VIDFLQVVVDAASLGSLYALLALAIGLLFGIMRLVNFAQGDYITLGAYALILPSGDAVATMLVGSWPWPVMVLTVVVVCVIAALLTERLVFRPLRRVDPETLLIASFAVSFLIQNVVLVVYGGRPKSAGILDGLTESVTLFGNLRVAGVELVTLATVALLLAALVLFLRYTSLGVQMRAVAEDFRMAQLLGVRGNRVIALAFGLSGLIGGITSVLIVAQTGVLDYRMGVLVIVYAFFATVVGGMGSLVGAALGGFVIGSLSVFLQAYLPVDMRPFRDAFLFAIVIGILLVRPQGLIVPRSARERV
jgi:branched-chain amino acid transport system permease protein